MFPVITHNKLLFSLLSPLPSFCVVPVSSGGVIMILDMGGFLIKHAFGSFSVIFYCLLISIERIWDEVSVWLFLLLCRVLLLCYSGNLVSEPGISKVLLQASFISVFCSLMSNNTAFSIGNSLLVHIDFWFPWTRTVLVVWYSVMIDSVWFLEGISSEVVGCVLFFLFLFVSVIISDTFTCVSSKVFPPLSELLLETIC